MNKELLIAHMDHLLTKYLNGRADLAELIQEDSYSVNYILAEIDQGKKLNMKKQILN